MHSRLIESLSKAELSPLVKCETFPSYVSEMNIIDNELEGSRRTILRETNKEMVDWLNEFMENNPWTTVYAHGVLNSSVMSGVTEDYEILGKVILSNENKVVVEDNPLRTVRSDIYARLGNPVDYVIFDKSFRLHDEDGLENCLWLGEHMEYIRGFYLYNSSTKNMSRTAALDRIN